MHPVCRTRPGAFEEVVDWPYVSRKVAARARGRCTRRASSRKVDLKRRVSVRKSTPACPRARSHAGVLEESTRRASSRQVDARASYGKSYASSRQSTRDAVLMKVHATS